MKIWILMSFGTATKKKSLGPPSYVDTEGSLPVEYSPSDVWDKCENKNKGKNGKHEVQTDFPKTLLDFPLFTCENPPKIH